MGFLDKAKEQAKQLGDEAKKLGEQAQQKLDEVQGNTNQGQPQAQPPGEPAVKYDKHGRPIEECLHLGVRCAQTSLRAAGGIEGQLRESNIGS